MLSKWFNKAHQPEQDLRMTRNELEKRLRIKGYSRNEAKHLTYVLNKAAPTIFKGRNGNDTG